jgi:predicted nucleic acid-binding protein
VVKSKNRVLLKKISNSLDAGESEAIVIAIELKADYLLMDERLGRQIANDYGIKLLGVLGILLRAKNVQLIQSVSELMDKLRDEAGFFIHQNLYKQVKELAGE